MKFIYGPIALLILTIGWIWTTGAPYINVSADNSCSEDSEQTEPCAEHGANLSVLLPAFLGGVDSELPQLPSDGTSGPVSKPPPSDGTPQPGTATPSNPGDATPTSAASPTPSSPTSSIPPTPAPTSTPDGNPSGNPNENPSGGLLFELPIVSELRQEGNALTVAWSGCDSATSARVMYGVDGQRPVQLITSEIAAAASGLTTPNLAEPGDYQVVVECYDAMGNSVFGTPAQIMVSSLEVQQ